MQPRVHSIRRGFTFLEIIAVMALMTSIVAVAIGYLSSGSRNLKKAAYLISRDIQTTYSISSKEAEFHRIRLKEDRQTFEIEKFVPPASRPVDDPADPDNRKKIEDWEEHQRNLDAMNPIERSERVRLERGSFKKLRSTVLPGNIKVKVFQTARGLRKEQKSENELLYMMFFPSGEVDQTLIVLEDGNEHYFSLTVNPLSGRVTAHQTELTESDWKKEISKP